jgi:hypothetical protein
MFGLIMQSIMYRTVRVVKWIVQFESSVNYSTYGHDIRLSIYTNIKATRQLILTLVPKELCTSTMNLFDFFNSSSSKK